MVAPAPAKLTYRKGPLLNAVEVFTIFWGKEWTSRPLSEMMRKLNGFFDFIVTSPLIDQMSEYNTAAIKIRYGRRTGSVTLTTNAPGASVTDTALQAFLKQQRAAGKVPKPTANTLYFIYLPPGVRVVMGGASVMSGVLWISQQHRERHVLRGDAVPRMFWMRRRPDAF